jgi:hypothetical protein
MAGNWGQSRAVGGQHGRWYAPPIGTPEEPPNLLGGAFWCVRARISRVSQ